MALKKGVLLNNVTAPSHESMPYAEIIGVLNSPDPVLRRGAAKLLSDYPESIEVLFQRLLDETDNSVCEAIATSIIKLSSVDVAFKVSSLFRSESARLRALADEILKNLQPEHILPVIDTLLFDSDPAVRMYAVTVIGLTSNEALTLHLVELIYREQDVNVTAYAIDILSNLKDARFFQIVLFVRRKFPDDPYIGFVIDTCIKKCEARR